MTAALVVRRRTRGASNSNLRGNSEARRRRRRWLVTHFGDGELVACFLQISRHCQWVLDEHTVWADRIEPGGSYRRDNIQPACGPCQERQGGLIGAARRLGTPVPRH